MSTNRKLQTGVRLALGVSAGALAVSVAPSAFAQEGADQVIEEVITTGSRIKRADLESASPVTVLSREDILAAGITDVGSLIQSMPSMSGSPIGTTTNNGGNGSVQIDLRGMGVDRTLTLINGKRTVDGGDYQTIPATMIERVEILKDGASAVYGADAVSGVVNIITRRDFEGIEVTVQQADFFDMDSGAQQTVSLIAGTAFEGGNFVFGAEYVDQEQAFQSDAPWDFFQDSYYIYPGGCENQVAAPYTGLPSGGCYPIGSSRIPESRLSFINRRDFLIDPATGLCLEDANGDCIPSANDFAGNGLMLIGTPATTPYEVGLMAVHDNRTYNYAPVNYIQTPYKRTNLFAEANFNVTENVRFNASIRGNLRTSAQELAPLPFTGGDPMFEGFFINPTTGATIAYEGVSEDNYYLRRAVDAYNLATGSSLLYQPLETPRRRMIETNRRFEQNITQYQFNAGLAGTLDNGMDWDVHYNEGYRSRVDRDFGQFSGVRLFNAMGPSMDADGDGQPECYTDITNVNTLIVGCVPLNFFGGGAVDAAGKPTVTTLTQDMIDYVALNTTDNIITKQQIGGFGISGSAFDLPGGQMGWAAGFTNWRQELTVTPDSAKLIGAVTGNVGAGTEGVLTNNSVYVEVLAPVMDNGTQSVTLKGGLRYDEWSAFENDTTWQFGVEFQAADNLKLRATAGTVFRAPTISDLFGGVIDSFPTYSDPCIPPPGGALPPGCAQVGIQTDSQLHALLGGNPFLIPETGDTFTAGLVWTPEFGNGDLSLTVDYWQVDIEDGMSSLGVQFILDDCYIAQNPASCALIQRTATYDIDFVIDGTLNVADQGAQGVDTEVRYNLDSDMGQWEFALLWSHLNERTKTPFAGAAEQLLAGTYTNVTAQDGGGYPDDKLNYSVQWRRNDLSVGYLGEYIAPMDTLDAGFIGNYLYEIDSQLYHDVIATYDFASTGTSVSVGITNITDEAPPYIDLGFNAKTDVAIYRQFGRGYYLRLTQSFE
jgi:outer membrane receptor protein involved in Fe transport